MEWWTYLYLNEGVWSGTVTNEFALDRIVSGFATLVSLESMHLCIYLVLNFFSAYDQDGGVDYSW